VKPVLFVAHGSPMNALGGTPYAELLRAWAAKIGKPRAILAISAHYETPRLAVTASPKPETIHDFGGFPAALFAVEYPVAGDPALARRVAELTGAELDATRGLDHGAWSPLRLLYPEADVPVVQLSLLRGAAPPKHVEAGRLLAPLAAEDVLVVGSGNVTHNLRTADLGEVEAPPEDWAVAFDAWVRDRLLAWDLEGLAAYRERAPQGRLAHPTPEHFAPLLVACGAADPGPAIEFPWQRFEHGTLSMRCVEMRRRA
jgi:4,5-DOPA dioxygenase extradiol